MSELPTEEVTHNSDNVIKKKPLNFRTEMLKGVHSPSDVLSPFSQKINLERNSALKNFKPKSLIDRLLGGKSSSQLGAVATESSETEQSESETEKQQPEFQEQNKDQEKENAVVVAPTSSTESAVPDF